MARFTYRVKFIVGTAEGTPDGRSTAEDHRPGRRDARRRHPAADLDLAGAAGHERRGGLPGVRPLHLRLRHAGHDPRPARLLRHGRPAQRRQPGRLPRRRRRAGLGRPPVREHPAAQDRAGADRAGPGRRGGRPLRTGALRGHGTGRPVQLTGLDPDSLGRRRPRPRPPPGPRIRHGHRGHRGQHRGDRTRRDAPPAGVRRGAVASGVGAGDSPGGGGPAAPAVPQAGARRGRGTVPAPCRADRRCPAGADC